MLRDKNVLRKYFFTLRDLYVNPNGFTYNHEVAHTQKNQSIACLIWKM